MLIGRLVAGDVLSCDLLPRKKPTASPNISKEIANMKGVNFFNITFIFNLKEEIVNSYI